MAGCHKRPSNLQRIVLLYLIGILALSNLDVGGPLLGLALFMIGIQSVGWAGILLGGLKAKVEK